jgi:extradiol dioxygenase family protein
MPPFHLAIPVDDLDAADRFYRELLGCPVGRTDPHWIDFDFFGHQLTVHLSTPTHAAPTNAVDGDAVPVRHFGVVLPWAAWQALGERLTAANIAFLIKPHVRFPGQIGEQGTMFIRDPAGNALEFKSFRDPSRLFAS